MWHCYAIHARMRRTLIGAELRSHHGVTRLPAERGGVHVGDALIGRKTENHDVQERGDTDKHQAVPYHRRLHVDGGINGRQFTGGPELAAAKEYPDGHQQEAKDKNSGQQQENQNTDIRVGRTGQDEIVNPESDQGDGTAGGQYHADEAQRVLAQVVEQPGPVFHCVMRTHRRIALAFSRTWNAGSRATRAPPKDTTRPVREQQCCEPAVQAHRRTYGCGYFNVPR